MDLKQPDKYKWLNGTMELLLSRNVSCERTTDIRSAMSSGDESYTCNALVNSDN